MVDVNYEDLIASALVDYLEVEVIKLSYSTWDNPLYLTWQLENGAQITLPDTSIATVYSVPMKLSDESQDGLVANSRGLTFQGINDLVAEYEDKMDLSIDERIKAEVLLYIADRDLNLSEPKANFTYYVMGIDYSQKSNSATLEISTNPTNESECGIKFTSTVFPSLQGVE